MGHEVHFLTSGSDSTLLGLARFWLKNRAKAKVSARVILSAFRPFKHEGVTQTAWFSIAHTANNFHRFWRFFSQIYRLGYCRALSRDRYDLAVFESSQGLLLFDRFRRLNPAARLVYRVSDDMVFLGNNPALLVAEQRLLPLFHLVTTPSAYITRRLRALDPSAKVVDHPHAIHKRAFKPDLPNPYTTRNNVVFAGLGDFDFGFLALAIKARPDCRFHLIGNMPRKVAAENVHYYGVLPFDQVIPYMMHADVGLQTLARSPGVEAFERTLKIVQYTYCRIPIVAPAYLNLPDAHVFRYEPTEESIRKALDGALSFDRSKVDASWVRDYAELAAQLLQS
jgi:2-beta-glucuronyltransferase